jgi:hypothetical protein
MCRLSDARCRSAWLIPIFDTLTVAHRSVEINTNVLSALPDLMLTGFAGSELDLAVSTNQITALQDNVFAGAASAHQLHTLLVFLPHLWLPRPSFPLLIWVERLFHVSNKTRLHFHVDVLFVIPPEDPISNNIFMLHSVNRLTL